jgi:hypothetical protein
LLATTNGLSASYAVVGSINGVTGGFDLTGVGRADGSASWRMTIKGDVLVEGDAVITGSLTNRAIAADTISSGGYGTGVGDTGDIIVPSDRVSKVLIIADSIHQNTGTFNLIITVNNVPIKTVVVGNGLAGMGHIVYLTEPSQKFAATAVTDSGHISDGFHDLSGASAYDDYVGTMWASPSASGWVQYLGAPSVAAQAYRVTGWSSQNRWNYGLLVSGTDATWAPKSWTLQGSLDGSSWTTLDTRASETGWTDGEERTYTFTNTTVYTYYRLLITANNGGTYMSVTRWALYQSSEMSGSSNLRVRAKLDPAYAVQVSCSVVNLNR